MNLAIRRSLIALGAFLVLFSVGLTTVAAQVDCSDAKWSQTTYCQNQTGNDPIFGPGGIMNEIISIIILVVTIASVIVILISGIRMAVSGGDSQTVSSARNGIIYALVGLAVAIVSQSIVVFVLNKL